MRESDTEKWLSELFGDLIRMRIDLGYLYEGEEVPWDEEGYLLPGNISVPYGTIATVLGVG